MKEMEFDVELLHAEASKACMALARALAKEPGVVTIGEVTPAPAPKAPEREPQRS